MKAKRKRGWIFILLFLVGLGIMLYPFVSQFIYGRAAKTEISYYQREVQKLSQSEKDHKYELAQAYNETLVQGRLADPWGVLHEEGIREYARMLEVHEKIGFVEIPAIDQEIPIYAGTSESVLQKGVGHMEGTSLPVGGINTHSVLTAHRGLPSAKLFTDLNKVKVKDVFYLHVLDQVLLYEVYEIEVIEPDEFEKLQILPEKDVVTLLTCTPYMVNSHRLLVKGTRMPYTPEEAPEPSEEIVEEIEETSCAWWIWVLLIFALLILVILIFIWRKKDPRRK